MSDIPDFDAFIYGSDGEKPMLKMLTRVLEEAKTDQARIQVDVRLGPEGTTTTRGEHQFVVEPETTTPDGIMRVLLERLNDSPGEGYAGTVRIIFSRAGSTGHRYGSFQRRVRPHAPMVPGFGPSAFGGSGFGRGPMGVRPGFRPRPAPSQGGDDEDDDELDNSIDHLDFGDDEDDGLPFRGLGGGPPPRQMGTGAAGGYGGGPGSYEHPPFVSVGQFQQWMEVSMGFTFRSMAQQMAMFERCIGFMDSIAVRYGLPHPEEPGITEVRGGAKEGSAGGLGLLPMLLNAAASLAGGKDPAEVVDNATQMAQGNAPPAGAARRMAIQGAANLVRTIPRGGRQPGPAPGFEPTGYDDPYAPRGGPPPRRVGPPPGRPRGPAPEDYDLGEDDYPPPPDPDDEGFDDEDFDFDEDEYPEVPEPREITPDDLVGMSADEMKEAVVKWIKADPSRKADVMNMLPELTKEVM